MNAMIIKEIRELIRDRRTLALLILVPVLLLIIYGYAANFSVDRTTIMIAGPGAKHTEQALRDNGVAQEHFDIAKVDTDLKEAEIEDLLRDRSYHAVIFASEAPTSDDTPLSANNHMYIEGSLLFAAQSSQQFWMRTIIEDNREKLSNAREQLEETRMAMERLQQQANPPTALPEFPEFPDTAETLDFDEFSTVLFNPDLKTSWVMVPGLIGLILAFVGTIATSIGLVREREAGTLEQLAVMPLRPIAIILGKVFPYFALALFDIAIITVISMWLFGVPFEGSIWRFAIVAMLFLLAVLGLGIFISSISQNSGQATQLAVMTIMPQVLLSGFIFPIESMSPVIQWISYILPLRWFNNAAQGIMLRNVTLEQISSSVTILTIMAIVIFGASTLRMHATLRKGGVTQ